MTSYDYDFVDVDWDNQTVTIVVGASRYDYSISEAANLIEGAYDMGVPGNYFPEGAEKIILEQADIEEVEEEWEDIDQDDEEW